MSRKRGTVMLSRLLLVGILLILSPYFLPTILFLFFALLPTLIALITDRSKIKYRWLCVGSLNMAGSMPYLFNIWFGSHDFQTAFSLISNVGNLAVIYGSAGFGFLVYLIIPPAVASYVQISNQKRLATLRETLDSLVSVWGEEVVTLSEEQLRAPSKK